MEHKPLYRRMKEMNGAELGALMERGKAPAEESLAGWEFRGWNHPPVLALLGIRKFVKGFFRAGAGLEGYNRPPRQDGFENEWTGAGRPFGFYDVVAPRAPDLRLPGALLLDYGANGRNPAWKPERFLRDYLVQPDPAEPDVLLGLATLALPGRPATNYFLLERLGRSEWRP
ncbi:MAG: hypothetical protein M0D55_12950 [Elusimicrobiota bacterium]|nr:MAG: hypothetical protein M0D55_12950 [Elusimicrobiota bacterium]